jgi:hypothetical protein
MKQMVGILVHGSNHFIVSGPLPDRETALALARHWSLIQIGQIAPDHLQRWQIRTKELRGNLEWAVSVPDADPISPAISELLEELSARGIITHSTLTDRW